MRCFKWCLRFQNPTVLGILKLNKQTRSFKHRKNPECCPGHYLIVNHQCYSILTQYHHVSTSTNLFCCCLGITDFCTVYPGSCFHFVSPENFRDFHLIFCFFFERFTNFPPFHACLSCFLALLHNASPSTQHTVKCGLANDTWCFKEIECFQIQYPMKNKILFPCKTNIWNIWITKNKPRTL